MGDKYDEQAREIVAGYRVSRRPLLEQVIAAALREVERDATERIAKLVEGGDPAMASYIRRQFSNPQQVRKP